MPRENYTTMINDEESRKAIVDEFVKQIELSKAAANTYYQMIKNKPSTPLVRRELTGNIVISCYSFASNIVFVAYCTPRLI